jgi:alginate O-acetyltransferase complex protein AlgI
LVLFGSAAIFWTLPARLRFSFLSVASFLYLTSLEPVGIPLLVLWTILFFFVAPKALREKRHSELVLLGLVLSILGYLCWEKYIPILAAALDDASPGVAIGAPLGVSYFTFKLIHYAVETSRGNIKNRSLSTFFAYIFLFPIFTAGPIERYDHFTANIEQSFNGQMIAEGLTRIAHGLIKIMLIAKLVAPANVGLGIPQNTEALTSNLGEIAVLKVWVFFALMYLYAYLDFSAYSDIAIGASRLFGIRIMENFRFPVLAINISDFWKRWHMTLAGWCQSYIYLPVLARTRTPYVAVFATFTAMGLWHGATFGWLLWGLYHATGVALYLTWTRYARELDWWRAATRSRWKYLGIPLTFAFVTGSYAFSSTGGGLMSVQVFLSLFGIGLGG